MQVQCELQTFFFFQTIRYQTYPDYIHSSDYFQSRWPWWHGLMVSGPTIQSWSVSDKISSIELALYARFIVFVGQILTRVSRSWTNAANGHKYWQVAKASTAGKIGVLDPTINRFLNLWWCNACSSKPFFTRSRRQKAILTSSPFYHRLSFFWDISTTIPSKPIIQFPQ